MKNIITLPSDSPARAIFTMDGDYMEPYIRDGEAVKLELRLPENGDCALFRAGEETLLRQYCEDCFGNIYLFALNRSQRHLDRSFPKGSALICLGRVMLERRAPLPLDFGG